MKEGCMVVVDDQSSEKVGHEIKIESVYAEYWWGLEKTDLQGGIRYLSEDFGLLSVESTEERASLLAYEGSIESWLLTKLEKKPPLERTIGSVYFIFSLNEKEFSVELCGSYVQIIHSAGDPAFWFRLYPSNIWPSTATIKDVLGMIRKLVFPIFFENPLTFGRIELPVMFGRVEDIKNRFKAARKI